MNNKIRVLALMVSVLLMSILFFSGSIQAAHAAPNAVVYDCSSQSSIPIIECEALVALYNNTNGDNWTYRFNPTVNWLTNNDPCSWEGVSCSASRVSHLLMDGMNLNGGLPQELENLTELEQIHMQNNSLVGEIPQELSNLTQLTFIRLDNNQLSGSIPLWFENLTLLDTLYLNRNGFSGSIPPELGNLGDLRYLLLNNNQLTGVIPPELGQLSQLQVLTLYYNQLTGTIPPGLGNLNLLRTLSLNNNQLTGAIPSQLGNLSQLGHLSLYRNQLTGTIPNEFGNLTQLNFLNIANNQLSGSFPAEIGSMTALTTLVFNNNPSLNGPLPHTLTNLSLLEHFWFYETQLCEPQDEAFQTWLLSIPDAESSQILCELPPPPPTPSGTATLQPTVTPSATFNYVPTSTPTSTPTATLTSTPTATSSATPTSTPTSTNTSTPTATLQPTSTHTATPTQEISVISISMFDVSTGALIEYGEDEQMSTNTEGWPEINPIEIQIEYTCPLGGSGTCDGELQIDITTTNDKGRLNLVDLTDTSTSGLSSCDGDSPGEKASSNRFSLTCTIFDLPEGEEMLVSYHIWIQPSEVTILEITADYYSTVPGNYSQSASLEIPHSKINPLIFIPGLSATIPSTYEQGDQYMTFSNVVANYNALYRYLAKLGYQKDETYFVFNYDWYRSAVTGASKLRTLKIDPASIIAAQVPWVQGNGNSNNIKFDFITHSTGGLIARAYIQLGDMHPGGVGKLITIGTPHMGLVDGYLILEGQDTEKDFISESLFFFDIYNRMLESEEFEDLVPWVELLDSAYQEITDENVYLYMHIPDELGGEASLFPQFLPIYDIHPAYLINYDGDPITRSGAYPYGRLANPLLENKPDSVPPGTDPQYQVFDYILDNPIVWQYYSERFPNFQTTYYDINKNAISILQTNTDKICLLYAKSAETKDRIEVAYPSAVAPFWFSGTMQYIIKELNGDELIPAISASLDLPDNSSLIKLINKTDIKHGSMVGEIETLLLAGECLTGNVNLVSSPETIAASSSEAGVSLDSALYITALSPVELLVTSPSGEQLGFRDDLGEDIFEIPNGFYLRESELGKKQIYIYNPEKGEYTVEILGIGNGSYTILSSYVDDTGFVTFPVLEATTSLNQLDTHVVTVPDFANQMVSPPDVFAGLDIKSEVNEAVQFEGFMEDINPDDTHTFTWDIDGIAVGNETLSFSHVFTDPGEYEVTLTVEDSSGFVISNTLSVTVTESQICVILDIQTLLDEMYGAGTIDQHVHRRFYNILTQALKHYENDRIDQSVKKFDSFLKWIDLYLEKDLIDQNTYDLLGDAASCVQGDLTP